MPAATSPGPVVQSSPVVSPSSPLFPSRAILRDVHQAIVDFGLIASGDRIAVGVSGGKDSLLLASVMDALSRRSDLDFTFALVHLDQHQPGFDRAGFDANLARLGMACEIVSKDTWSVVESKLSPGQIPCSLCGRMRRGVLNEWCRDHGFTKLALGHHLDDAIETFLLNLLFGRRLAPMRPSSPQDRLGTHVIRPLILVPEARIIDWVTRSGLHPVPCPVCDTFPRSSRRDLGQALDVLRERWPEIDQSVRGALYDRGPAALDRISAAFGAEDDDIP